MVTLKINVTDQMEKELALLVQTGHFGKDRNAAAERIIAAELHRLFGAEAVEAAKQRARFKSVKRKD